MDAEAVHKFFLAELMVVAIETGMNIAVEKAGTEGCLSFHANTVIKGVDCYVATCLIKDSVDGVVEIAFFNRDNYEEFGGDDMCWVLFDTDRISFRDYFQDSLELLRDT